MDLPAWAIWVVVAVAMLGIEATTSSFFTIYFAVSAAIVAVLAVLSGVDAMRGRIGVVTTAIGELEPGQVKLGGETWSARSYFEHEPIALGTRIEVVEIKGVTALVIAAPDDRTELPKET